MRPIIHLVVNLAASCVFVWWAMRGGPIPNRTRLTIGILWGLVGLLDVVAPDGAYDRLIGAAALVTAYVVLMPFFPWRRSSSTGRPSRV